MIYANYIPDTSELAFALSLTLLGALHVFAEARNVDQALSRELFQSVRAAFADLENAAQAASGTRWTVIPLRSGTPNH